MPIYRIQAIYKSELEKKAISNIISRNDDFFIEYYSSYDRNSNKPDLYLINSLIMFSIQRNDFFYPNAPVICYGPIDHISLAYTYNILDYIQFPFYNSEFSTRIYKSLPAKYYFTLTNYISLFGTKIMYHDKSIELTNTELSMLRILISSFPYAIQRDILCDILNNDTQPDSRSLDMCMSKLRKKLKTLINSDLNLIQSERSYGYKLMQY